MSVSDGLHAACAVAAISPKVYPVRALRTIINENNRSRDSAFSSRYPPVRLICHAILKGPAVDRKLQPLIAR